MDKRQYPPGDNQVNGAPNLHPHEHVMQRKYHAAYGRLVQTARAKQRNQNGGQFPAAPRHNVSADQTTIRIDETHTVSGLIQIPDRAFACVVLAHGAGAGMTHKFMTAVADGFEQRGVATLRFQFPYMEAGSKRPDRPPLAHAAILAAVEAAPNLPLFASGKSFGARMTSQAQALAPLPNVRGLLFFGFPLHPAGKPSVERANHLAEIRIPMLFLQGTRDALAETPLLLPTIQALGPASRLKLIHQADHSFHVPVRSGNSDEQVLNEILDESTAWMQEIL